jgi:hypothetical protein
MLIDPRRRELSDGEQAEARAEMASRSGVRDRAEVPHGERAARLLEGFASCRMKGAMVSTSFAPDGAA